jgi:hypothetical protein
MPGNSTWNGSEAMEGLLLKRPLRFTRLSRSNGAEPDFELQRHDLARASNHPSKPIDSKAQECSINSIRINVNATKADSYIEDDRDHQIREAQHHIGPVPHSGRAKDIRSVASDQWILVARIVPRSGFYITYPTECGCYKLDKI